jgi:hypothetical protein
MGSENMRKNVGQGQRTVFTSKTTGKNKDRTKMSVPLLPLPRCINSQAIDLPESLTEFTGLVVDNWGKRISESGYRRLDGGLTSVAGIPPNLTTRPSPGVASPVALDENKRVSSR